MVRPHEFFNYRGIFLKNHLSYTNRHQISTGCTNNYGNDTRKFWKCFDMLTKEIIATEFEIKPKGIKRWHC